MRVAGHHVSLTIQAKPQRIGWLTPLVFLINLAGLGLLVGYSLLNLRPDLPDSQGLEQFVFLALFFVLVVVAPTIATLVYVAPVVRWLRQDGAEKATERQAAIALRAANAPLALAAFSLLAWTLVAAIAAIQSVSAGPEIGLGIAVHLVLRPPLAGLVVATGTFFSAEFICRVHVWPVLLAGTRIAGNQRLWRVRIAHRLLVLWLAIGALPLGTVALTTYARVAGLDLAADPLLGRVVSVVLLVALTAALGGAWLAWLVSRSIAQPLEVLETALADLRDGRFDRRVAVNATDEIGVVTEGFNLMAERLSQSHAELATRNRALTEALERVIFLEQVKSALDRFVPEAVRHAIEAHPDAPGLAKEARDVTVLFLDIEGYARLSEELPRPVLNALVERYFSLFLTSIRGEGGDINETAGDGLMIIFHAADPDAHAAAALRAALAIQAQTSLANRTAGLAEPQICINIGISSGECDVGATRLQGPSGERWTFTASGPVTNLAARLSAYANGGQILLAEATVRRLGEHFALRSLGAVELKNLSHPVLVWEARIPTHAPEVSPGRVDGLERSKGPLHVGS